MYNPQKFVEDAINDNNVVVFGKSYCPYCKKAKALLESLDIEYINFDIDLLPEGVEIQKYLLDKTGQRTVPNIFAVRTHIGGSDALVKADEDGSLQKLLEG